MFEDGKIIKLKPSFPTIKKRKKSRTQLYVECGFENYIGITLFIYLLSAAKRSSIT